MNEETQAQPSSGTDSADIHDRVAEAYYGLMGPKFMRDTQNRIHWICREIQGKNVLDVGCSQGIVPILLAREGLKVIGVDSSPKAIDEATRYLASEPKQVRKNVSFVNSDFLSWDFHGLNIDTVVMSEVLEHLTRPDYFIETAARILARKGRLIVTVPFGINDFIDHKHTFYLLKPLRLIAKHFDIVDLDVLGSWLGVVADRRTGADRGTETFRPTIALMEKLESAFYQTERSLRDELSLARTKQEEANRKYRGATEQITALKQRVTQEEKGRQVSKQRLAQVPAQQKQAQSCLQAERTAPQQQLVQVSAEGQVKEVVAHEAEGNLLRMEAELEAGRIQLEEANQKHRAATEQVTALQQRVTQEETARQAAEQVWAQATTRLEQAQSDLQEVEQTQSDLQEERAGLLRQLAQVTA
ncbi:MAG: methyltransferase domain-containing protein, partial [Nitrospira sp. CG24E]